MMAEIKLKLVILFICSLTFIYTFASKHTFTKLSVENGLSNNEVNVIYKDSQGFIWFGTLLGLDRFDGIEIRSYANKFPQQIENVVSIEEDATGNLWVGTSEGLYKHNQGTDRFVKMSLNQNFSVNEVRSVKDTLLFLGTDKGLVVFNTETMRVQHVLLDSNPASGQNFISDILVDNHGSCWMATHKGLVRVDVDDREINNYYFESEYQENYNSFTSICTIGNRMYLGTTNVGIVEFDLNAKIFRKNNKLDNYLVTCVASDNREKLFIGTNGAGLIIYNLRTKKIETIEKDEDDPRSLSSNSIYSFLIDETQRFWIGTYSGGVNYSNTVSGGFQLHKISTEYASVSKSIRSFYFASDGNEYFGTRNGFIHRTPEGEILSFKSTNSKLRSNIILTLFPFKENILIGTYGGGISSYNPQTNRIEDFLTEKVFIDGNNYTFIRGKWGDLWIASFQGFFRYSNNRLIKYDSENIGLISNHVFSLLIDSRNRIWAGTDNGVSVFEIRNDSLQLVNLPAQIDNQYKVNYIKEDLAGNIHICNEIGGLLILDGNLGNFKRYKQQDGLPDNSICAIVENSPGSFWISTLKGFCHFSFEDNQFKNYSISDGLPGLVFSPAAAYLANDGQLWFGNEKGLLGFYPEDVDEKVIQSPIILTNLFIAGQNIKSGENSILKKPIEFTDELVLDYKSNSIGFRFVDLNYLSRFDNNYYTILEGYQDEWQNNGNGNNVFYDRLKPGKYTFKVKNVVSANEESEGTLELAIVIRQAFTRSMVFWGIVAFIVLLFGIYIYRILKKLIIIKREYIKEHAEIKKYQSSGLSEQDLKDIVEKVKQYLKVEKVYLNADLKLSEVSMQLNIPTHHISQALNQVLGHGFADFVNKFRVREVRYMLENDAHQKLTLMAVARQCGFNSKTSFYRVFKKFTGKTPVDYIDSLKS